MNHEQKLEHVSKCIRVATGIKPDRISEKEMSITITNQYPDDEKGRFQQNVAEKICQAVNTLKMLAMDDTQQGGTFIKTVYDMKTKGDSIIFTFEVFA